MAYQERTKSDIKNERSNSNKPQEIGSQIFEEPRNQSSRSVAKRDKIRGNGAIKISERIETSNNEMNDNKNSKK
jgi:hypothetical protein